jgi:hypothetical protein
VFFSWCLVLVAKPPLKSMHLLRAGTMQATQGI